MGTNNKGIYCLYIRIKCVLCSVQLRSGGVGDPNGTKACIPTNRNSTWPYTGTYITNYYG